MMKDFRLKALGLGVDFEMKPFTDEKCIGRFQGKAMRCALITGTRVDLAHKFSSTIEPWGLAHLRYAEIDHWSLVEFKGCGLHEER